MPARRFYRKRKSYRRRRSGYRAKRKIYRRKSFRRRRTARRTRTAFLRTIQYSGNFNKNFAVNSFVSYREPVKMHLLNRWTELSPLFQFFKIKSVTLQVFHNGFDSSQGNITDVNITDVTGGMGGTLVNRPKGRLYVYTYPWNSWDTTAIDSNSIMEMEGVKKYRIKPGWNNIPLGRPKWMSENAASSTTTAEIDKPAGWVPWKNPEVQHWVRGYCTESSDLNYIHPTVMRYKCVVYCKGLH